MKKICIYVGTNTGFGLNKLGLVNQFDELHLFEPDPEIFNILKNDFSEYNNLIFNNFACSKESGIKKLYITENRVSTSLSEVDTSTFDSIGYHSGGKPSVRCIEVKTINLYDYIVETNIEYVDYLITDTQGSDLEILKTLKPYIDNRKIKKLFCETHGNGKSLYVELDNQFDGFKELLSDNYEIAYYSFDGQYKPKDYVIQDTDVEWDTCWVLK